jgi:hypothetical protein
MASGPSPKKSRRLRLSIRAMLVLVLAFGTFLGWLSHRARVQRIAVATIERAGGKVYYDSGPENPRPMTSGVEQEKESRIPE